MFPTSSTPSDITHVPASQQATQEALNEALLIACWLQWSTEAPAGSNEFRELALARLQDCLRRGARELNLTSLQLSSLPPLLPLQLEKLRLDDNRLLRLPALPDGLRQLSVVSNQLCELPEYLPTSLTRLRCQNNLLTRLPESLKDLPDSVHISVENNPLEIPTLLWLLQRFHEEREETEPRKAVINFSLSGTTAATIASHAEISPRLRELLTRGMDENPRLVMFVRPGR